MAWKKMGIGQVAWAVTGRFYALPSGQVFDVGYFLELGGLTGLFKGSPAEGSAWLTFAAKPFAAATASNGPLSIGLDPDGRFSVYLREKPGADFSAPESFSQGAEIATFQRRHVVMGVSLGAMTSNLFSARLIESRDFVLNGETWNLRDLIPGGVTQSGIASQAGLPAPAGYTLALAFSGTAIATGASE